MAVNNAALHLLMARAQYDLAAAQSALLVVIGDRLGLYRLLADTSLNAEDLAARSGVDLRYLESWLLNQVAGGYVTLDVSNSVYSLTPEQKAALTDETSAFFLPASFALASSLAPIAGALESAMRTGNGLSPQAYSPATFDAIGRMAKAKSASIVSSAFSEDTRSALTAGARVLDVGCGEGHVLMALAGRYTKIRAVGIDVHRPSILRARDAARSAGLSQRLEFEDRDAHDLPARMYDLILCIETLHELANPVAVMRAIRGALRDGGRCVIVEALAGDSISENLNPSGRLLSAINLLFCLPTSLASGGGAIGALAGEARLRDTVTTSGFTSIRRQESGTQLILEAQP